MKLSFKRVIGKTILVGITYEKEENCPLSMIQFSGQIIHADANNGIAICSENLMQVVSLIPETGYKGNGDVYVLPPDLSAIKKAPKGEYRLHSTGEVVKDPQLLTTWTIKITANNVGEMK